MILGVVAVVVVVVIIAVAVGSKSSPTYNATVDQIAEIDPGHLSVQFTITNNGSVSETPSCTVSATGADPAYFGIDYSISPTNSLGPGASVTLFDTLTITDQGAASIDQNEVKLQCR
jgi:hypothetical protein